MLKRLKIEGFRCFDSLELEFGSKQLLLGSNGTGKSTVFELLDLLRRFVLGGDRAADVFPLALRSRWTPRTEIKVELEVIVEADIFQYALALRRLSDTLIRVGKETLVVSGRERYSMFSPNSSASVSVAVKGVYDDEDKEYPADVERSGLSHPIAKERLPKGFYRWFETLVTVQPDPAAITLVSSVKAEHPSRNPGDLASWYRNIGGDERLALEGSLAEVLPGFTSFQVTSVSDTRDVASAVFRRDGKDVRFTLDELSDGQRILIELYALLHFGLRAGSTLCIDEPDNFIALSEIQPWLFELFDRADALGAQVLLISHHPELIDQMARDHGLLLYRDAEGTIKAKPYAQEAGINIPASEYVARGWEHG